MRLVGFFPTLLVRCVTATRGGWLTSIPALRLTPQAFDVDRLPRQPPRFAPVVSARRTETSLRYSGVPTPLFGAQILAADLVGRRAASCGRCTRGGYDLAVVLRYPPRAGFDLRELRHLLRSGEDRDTCSYQASKHISECTLLLATLHSLEQRKPPGPRSEARGVLHTRSLTEKFFRLLAGDVEAGPAGEAEQRG